MDVMRLPLFRYQCLQTVLVKEKIMRSSSHALFLDSLSLGKYCISNCHFLPGYRTRSNLIGLHKNLPVEYILVEEQFSNDETKLISCYNFFHRIPRPTDSL